MISTTSHANRFLHSAVIALAISLSSLLMPALALDAKSNAAVASKPVKTTQKTTLKNDAQVISLNPDLWVGTWIYQTECAADEPRAEGGFYYAKGGSLTIRPNMASEHIQVLYEDARCTVKAGQLRDNGSFTNVRQKKVSGYTASATVEMVSTGAKAEAAGGTGVILRYMPASSDEFEFWLVGINSKTHQWCFAKDKSNLNFPSNFVENDDHFSLCLTRQ